MYYKPLLLVMLLLKISITTAQQPSTSFYRVHFKSDKYDLSESEKTILSNALRDANEACYYEIELSAHTDNDAANDYNLTLSKQRAKAVSDYLIANGMNASKISVKWFGENKPTLSNANETGKSENRRVEVAIKKYNFNDPDELLRMAADNYTQTFSVKANEGTVIKGKQGTRITIPKDAFVTKDGKPVTAENVTIKLEEYQKPADALFNKLSTICDGKLLETGGMFAITASVNGEELQVNKGKTLDVQMPSGNQQNNMELFVGEKNKEGVMEWKATSQPFKSQMEAKRDAIYTNLNTAYLKTLYQKAPCEHAALISSEYPMVNKPQLPAKFRKPRLLETPTKETTFNWWQRTFVPNFMLKGKLEDEQKRAEEINAKRTTRYEKKIALFAVELNRYKKDSLAFTTEELDKFRTWATNQQQYCKEAIEAIHHICFNKALDQLITKSDANQITTLNVRDLFYRCETPNYYQQELLNRYNRLIGNLSFALNLNKMEDIVSAFTYQGKLNFETRNGKWRAYTYNRWYEDGDYYSYGAQLMKTDPKFNNIFTAATEDIIDKRDKAGVIDRTTASMVYTVSVSNTGVFNCDRFSDYKENQMANINIQGPANARVSFYIPSLKGYIYAYGGANGYHARLPKNMEVLMVVYQFKEDSGPLFCCEKKTFTGKQETVTPDLKTVSLRQIRETLTSL